MSAPDTNIETQARKHRAPLMGIGGAMIFAALAAVVIAVFLFAFDGDSADVNPVGGDAAQVDGEAAATDPQTTTSTATGAAGN